MQVIINLLIKTIYRTPSLSLSPSLLRPSCWNKLDVASRHDRTLSRVEPCEAARQAEFGLLVKCKSSRCHT